MAIRNAGFSSNLKYEYKLKIGYWLKMKRYLIPHYA